MVVAQPVSAAAAAEGLILLHALVGCALGPAGGDASSVGLALAFALAHGRPRAFLAPLALLWLLLRGLSGPLALGAFLPLVVLPVLALPVLRQVLPSAHPARAARVAVAIAVAGGCARAALAPERRTSFAAADFVFLIPLVGHFDALAAGWLLGCTAPPRIPVAVAAALALAAPVLAAIAASAVGDGSDFFARAARGGALVPLSATLVVACDALPPLAMHRLTRVLYAALVAVAPARRALQARWCEPALRKLHPRWGRLVCITPVPCKPDAARWMAWLHRCVPPGHSGSFGGVHPVVLLPFVFAFAMLFAALVHAPLERLCLRLTEGTPDWPMLPDPSVSYGEDDACIEGIDAPPKRDNSILDRVFRLAGYYLGMLCFFMLFMKVGVPTSLYLFRRSRNPIFCSLPKMLYNCADIVADASPAGSLQNASQTLWFKAILATCRVISMLALPTMLLNLVLHIFFPRANWKRMHSLQYMLRNAEIGYNGLHNDGLNPISPVSEADEPLDGQSIAPSPPVRPDLALPNVTLDLPGVFSDHALPLDFHFVVYFRYVTRGSNARLMRRNARHAARVLRACGLPDAMWRVEVVTDQSIDLDPSDPSVYELVVPSSYAPPRGALYKARALEYAIEHSPARDVDWVVHLDEETRFDADTVTGIVAHCGRQQHAAYVEKRETYPRIGQGPIVYGRAMVRALHRDGDPSRNWVTTLADSSRVSDDCGRFRGQYECGEVWVGMHGSFVVAPNAVEKLVRFDHGIAGSIAEDAFFALLARAAGTKFAWIDALMFEQSPFTFTDFVKQRARWLVGGQLVVTSPEIPLRVRPVMGALSLLWSLMPLTYLALFASVTLGGLERGNEAAHWFCTLALPLGAAVSMWGYFFGFWVTFAGQRLGVARFTVLLYLQMMLTPVFGIMEVSAVLYGLFYFRTLSVGFHVVDKDGAAAGKVEEVEKGSMSLPLTTATGKSTETTRLLNGT